MTDETQQRDQIEVEGFGGKFKASPDSIARTIAAIGTFLLLACVLYWEAMHGRPAMIDRMNAGWRESDERHQKILIEQQEKADARLDRLVERHAEAIGSLRDAIQNRKVAGQAPTATGSTP